MTNQIILYGLTTCAQCAAVRNMLLDNRIHFELIDLDILPDPERRSRLAALKEINPKCSFPTLKFENTVVVGQNKNKILNLIADYRRAHG